MKTPRTYAIQPEDDLADKIILSVRTKGFESQVEVPVPLGPRGMDAFVSSWLNMMAEALKMPHAAQTRNPNWATPIGACIHCKQKPCACAIAQASA